VVALATKCTGDETVAPLLGLVTVTPANAEAAKVAMAKKYTCNFLIKRFSPALIGTKWLLPW
jgi:hypothetical protein